MVRRNAHCRCVFPTHVGVFLSVWVLPVLLLRLPHARGGVSNYRCSACWEKLSSPRTWGCFYKDRYFVSCAEVFPTHVGVFLEAHADPRPRLGLPHARGGVSAEADSSPNAAQSSPRTWGCFRLASELDHGRGVFPTHVGVFLPDTSPYWSCSGLPHARGGVSSDKSRP